MSAGAVLTPDLCVIGAGSGGLSVAAGAAQMGADVVLFEAARMGGDCLNVGCVPSKALLAAAKAAHGRRDGAAFGLSPVAAPPVDLARVMAHVRDVVATIAPHDSQERFEGLGARVLRARARFVDALTVEGGGMRVRARRFVLATGSRPSVPPVPGLDRVPYLTNETVWDLQQLPAHLLVLGAGAIGCELGQAFRRLGAAVTLVEPFAMLGRDDGELVAVLRGRLASDGVVLHESVKVTQVEGAAGDLRVTIETAAGTRTLAGSHLLVATGRRPAIDDLGLDAAGIAADARGIKVDGGLRTSNRRVFAIGDCIDGPRFTHAAGHQAGIVLRRALFRLPARWDRAAMPHVTFTDPELAQVGLTEAEAKQAIPGHRVLRWPMAQNDRAVAERQTDGLVKVVIDRRGRVRGAGMVGADAGELLAPWALAIAQGLKIGAMAGTVLPYPTRAEAGKRAAGSAFTATLFGPRMRRLVRLLRVLP
ncbi:MAG: FAD-dependent oxidoreductase [Alphaproteobacteria bacterium]|nr:FAD-dependent oxidoreductase [Alphaproteobacteria bacterium]